MKKTVMPSALALALIFGSCGNSSVSKESTEAFDTTKLKTGEAYYQCVMHPEIVSGKPGSCPKCNMDLMKAEKK